MMGWMLMVLGLMCGGDREQGLQLYREGRYAEAAAAFQRAVQSEGDSAELQWNLALAHWRAGELGAAEIAAEKYAATSSAVQVDLHRGLLGAIRYQEALLKVAEADQAQAAAGQPPAAAAGAAPDAPADPLPLLQAALAKANQARDHFVRGAKVEATPELRRNTERTLRLIDELKRRIEELEKQRQPSDDKDQQDSKQEDKPDESKQNDSSQEKQDQKQSEPKPDENEKQPEPEGKEQDQKDQKDQKDPKNQESGKPDQSQTGEDDKPSSAGEPKPEPQPGAKPGDQAQPQPEPGQASEAEPTDPSEPAKDGKPGSASPPRQDAPGEQLEERELSPEQTQRLLERLQGLDGKQKAIRARAKSSRRTVERDW